LGGFHLYGRTVIPPSPPIHTITKRYCSAIVAVEKLPGAPSAWALALIRTELATSLADGARIGTLIDVLKLDQRARYALARTRARDLPVFDAMRRARGGNDDDWWWSSQYWVVKSHADFLRFGLLTCWGVALAVTSDTIARWLSSAPDWTTLIAIVVQVLVTFLGGAPFVEQGRAAFQRATAVFDQPIGHWQRFAVLGSAAILASAVSVRLALPEIATLYGQQGQTHYRDGRLADAINSWRRAVALDPDAWQFRYQLGSGLELQADTDAAIAQYRLAVATPEAPAFVLNNLARLYLTEKNNPGTALLLLEPALLRYQTKDIVRYRMLINRGTAFLALKLPKLAAFDARAAAAIAQHLRWESAPSAACLLALALEGESASAAAAFWKSCLSASVEDKVSDRRWLALAREKLLKENP
jgi:tetratricopeptide (TPR) repeat protein